MIARRATSDDPFARGDLARLLQLDVTKLGAHDDRRVSDGHILLVVERAHRCQRVVGDVTVRERHGKKGGCRRWHCCAPVSRFGGSPPHPNGVTVAVRATAPSRHIASDV